MLFQKRLISNYFITTKEKIKSSKEWYYIMINGEETCYLTNRKGEVKNEWTNRLLSPMQSKSGYYWYYHLMHDKKRVVVMRHRLIACLFIPIPKKYLKMGFNQEYLEVNHIDGDATNYDIDNLEWVLPIENKKHVFVHDEVIKPKYTREKTKGQTLQDRKKYISRNVITESQVREICELLDQGYDIDEIYKRSNIPNISYSIIQSIKHGRSWSHISKDYNFSKDPKRKRMTVDQVREICELIDNKKSDKYIRNLYNIKQYQLTEIKGGRSWVGISKDYNFMKNNENIKVEEDGYHVK